MDYDFSNLCADQLERVEKRLDALRKAFVKQYHVSLDVINNKHANDKRGETIQLIEDLFRDQIKKDNIFWTECFNKVQRSLKQYL